MNIYDISVRIIKTENDLPFISIVLFESWYSASYLQEHVLYFLSLSPDLLISNQAMTINSLILPFLTSPSLTKLNSDWIEVNSSGGGYFTGNIV